MRHTILDRWSAGDSWLHRRDARAKLGCLLLLLAWIGTTSPFPPEAAAGYGGLLLVAIATAGLPVVGLFGRAALVLPFTVTFAAIALVSGETNRAVALLEKSYLSALAIATVAGVTPMPAILNAAEAFGAPRILITVTQFLYRYLFVLVEKGHRMKLAAECRGGFRWQAAGGAVAVLFGSGYQTAEGVHQAMLARGFEGKVPSLRRTHWRAADTMLVVGLSLALIAGRLAWSL